MLKLVTLTYTVLVFPITFLHNLAFWSGVSVFEHKGKTFLVYREIAQVLEQAHYTINFFLYVLASKNVRIHLLRMSRVGNLRKIAEAPIS